VASDSHPSSRSTQGSAHLEKVVDVASSWLPGGTLVSTDLELGGTTLCVLDRGGDPVLRSTAVHLDPERLGGCKWARDKLPLDVVDSTAGAAVELVEGVRGHVQVGSVTTSLVGDLGSVRYQDVIKRG